MRTKEFDAELVARWERTIHRDHLLVAHVCDAHVLRPDEDRAEIHEQFPTPHWPRERFEAALAEIAALSVRPDLLLLGGDMTETGERAEWRVVFDLLARTGIPYLVTLGNHEHAALAPHERGYAESVSALRDGDGTQSQADEVWAYRTDVGGYQFVIVDSLETGDLGPRQHALLADAMARDVPTVISCHRPLVPVGNWMDPYMLVDPEFDDLLASSDSVLAVLSGHVHKRRAVRKRNRLHLVGLAACYGIGDGTGYRLLCLADGNIAWSVVRTLPGPACHEFKAEAVVQEGGLEWEILA